MPPSRFGAADLARRQRHQRRTLLGFAPRLAGLADLRVRGLAVVLLWLGTAVTLLPLPVAWLGHDVVRTLILMVKASILVLLPGTSLVLALRPLERLEALRAVGMGVAASLALCPLALLWATTAGVSITPNALKGVLAVCALFLSWHILVVTPDTAPVVRPVGRAERVAALALGAVFLLALAGRLYSIWGVVYPPGADTYHHTIITEMILRTGAIPAGYRPYAPIDGYSYHFGYHTYTAFLAMLTGLPAHRAVFWGAQFLNALTVPVLYALVAGVTGNRRAGIGAAIVAGLTCHMPAAYMIWGRDPQLAGLVILPVLMALTMPSEAGALFPWRRVALAGILLAGLGLTHYRVTILYGAFALVAGCYALIRRGLSWRRAAHVARGLAAVGLIALALAGPWIASFLRGAAPMDQQAVSLNQTEQLDALTWEELVTWGLRPPLLIATLLACGWAIWRRRRWPLPAMMIAWTALLLILATPQLSGLPPGFVTYRTVIITLYLPAAVVLGAGLSVVPDLEVRTVTRDADGERRGAPMLVRLGVLALLVCIGWGGYETARVRAMPRHVLVRNVDREAMDWIRANTPADALFAVEPLFYQPSAAAGSDAGYWLPYATGRPTVLPPMIYTADGAPEYVAETNAWLRSMMEARSSDELADLLRARGAQYVYITGQTEHSWKGLAQDERLFEVVYQVEDVRVVRLR